MSAVLPFPLFAQCEKRSVGTFLAHGSISGLSDGGSRGGRGEEHREQHPAQPRSTLLCKKAQKKPKKKKKKEVPKAELNSLSNQLNV